MFWVLLKKQLLQLNQFYFYNPKTGKRRNPASIIGMVFLFLLVFFSFGMAVFGLSTTLLVGIAKAKVYWLFFAMMGLVSIFVGVLGGGYTAYPTIYNAKDNDLLISFPISTSSLILVRTVSVYIMTVLYSAFIWLPALLAFWVVCGVPSVLSVIYSLLLLPILCIADVALSCLLGFIIAAISSRVKNKSLTSIVFSFLFIGVYYIFYFRTDYYIELLTKNLKDVIAFFDTKFIVFKFLGEGAMGNTLSLLYFLGIVVALFLVIWYLLQRSFIGIVTHTSKFKKARFSNKDIRTRSVGRALLSKEFRRFWKCPAYVLNAGFGIVIELGFTVFLIVKSGIIREYLYSIENLNPELDLAVYLPGAIALTLCFLASTNAISAPSVSLEGKSIWILQSYPVEAHKPLFAKEQMHIILNGIPAVLGAITMDIICYVPWYNMILTLLFVLSFISLMGSLGVMSNLRHPNLNWTNENVPIKQSVSVLICMFGGWVLIGILAVVFLISAFFLPPYIFLSIISLFFIGLCVLINKWIRTKGATIFATL